MNDTTIDLLLVDDEEAHAEAIRRILDDSALRVAVRVVGTLAGFRAAVAQAPPQIALVDLNLPDGRAVELLSTPLQEAPFPILIMTSHGNEQTAVEALKAGALDYLVKSPEAFAGMPRFIERALREWGLLQERRQAEQALLAAKEAAEAASRAKSEFLALMSHELRTPLNGVMGGVQMLRCSELSPGQRECLDLIMSSAENQLFLVNDILDLARLESGGVAVERGEFSLRQSVEEVVRLQRAEIRGKGLALSVEVAGEIPETVVGDALRFRQILLKMLANAVKFTAVGSIAVTLDLVARHDDGIVVRCSVADTGIGVEREQIDRIFAPFVQADMSSTRKYGGSGLGLTICRRMTEALGGRIWFENNRGQGSIFSFELPLRSVPPDAAVPAPAVSSETPASLTALVPPVSDGPPEPLGEPRPASEPEPVREPGPAGKPKPPRTLKEVRVLLVDDDATCLKVFSGILDKLSGGVVCAVNGREALERWQDSGPFDVILMDIQMPVMSGLEALHAIRARERDQGGHVPVIAQTAHAMQRDQALLLAEGFDGYLAKPLLISELIGQITQVTGCGAPALAVSAIGGGL
jgi:signal transduction histidine kinase